jgi:hypothetical protein
VIIAAVDPGKVSGVCLVEFRDVSQRIDAITSPDCALLGSAELEFPEILGRCEETIPQADQVAMEKFTITPQTGKNTQAPWSLRVEGIVMAIALRSCTTATLQTPADAKSLVNNDLLRCLRLWHRGGAGHANDALRHAVLLAIRRGWRSPALTGNL